MILSILCKGSLILGAAWIAITILRNHSPSHRSNVWAMAFALLLILPLLSFSLPAWNIIPAVEFRTAKTETASRLNSPATSAFGMPSTKRLTTQLTQPVAGVPEPQNEYPANAPDSLNEVENPFVQQTGATISPAKADASSTTNDRNWDSGYWNLASLKRLFVAVWVIGFVGLLARLVLSAILLRRQEGDPNSIVLKFDVGLSQQNDHQRNDAVSAIAPTAVATARQLNVKRPFRILVSSAQSSPFVWGHLRPRITLPQQSLTWDRSKLESVLMHELAHVQRWDAAIHVVVQLAIALHWFNPIAWLAACRLSNERESACDDLVLNAGVRPNIYARHLIAVADEYRHPVPGNVVTVAMARNSGLQSRLQRILSVQSSRRSITLCGLVFHLLLSLAVALPVAMASNAVPQEIDNAPEATADDQDPPAVNDLFYALWSYNRYEMKKIPSGLIHLLADELENWLTRKSTTTLQPVTAVEIETVNQLTTLMRERRDWAPSDIKAMLRQISQIDNEPLEIATRKIELVRLNRFQTCRIRDYAYIEKMVWGKAAPNGLRVGVALKQEDQSQNYLSGASWYRVFYLENTGNDTLLISSPPVHLSAKNLTVTDEAGTEIPVTGVGKPHVDYTYNYVLGPKESCIIDCPPIYFGSRENDLSIEIKKTQKIRLNFESFDFVVSKNPLITENSGLENRRVFFDVLTKRTAEADGSWDPRFINWGPAAGGVIVEPGSEFADKLDTVSKQGKWNELVELLASQKLATPFTGSLPGFSVELSVEALAQVDGEHELKDVFAELFDWNKDRLERLIAASKADDRPKLTAIMREETPYPKFNRMMRLAQAWPASETAMEAALLTMKTTYGPERDVAMEILVGHHIESSRIAEALPRTNYTTRRKSWARQILKANSNPVVMAHAKWEIGPPVPDFIHDVEPQEAIDFYLDIIRDFGDIEYLPNYWGVPQPSKTLGELALHSIRKIEAKTLWAKGTKLPEFEGIDLDGNPISLKDYQGKTTLIVYWTTWCGPCMQMAQIEKKLLERYADHAFDIMGVCGNFSADFDDEKKQLEHAARIRQAAQQHGINWRSVRDKLPNGDKVSDLLGFPSLPYTLLVDGDGIVRSTSFINGGVADTAEQAKLMMLEIEKVLGGGFEPTDAIAQAVQEQIYADQAAARAQPIYKKLQTSIAKQDFAASKKLIDQVIADTTPSSLKAHVLNYLSWSMYEKHLQQALDKDHLQLALKAAEQAVDEKPENSMILDTLAHLLFENGQLKLAIEVQQKAVDHADEQTRNQFLPFLVKLRQL